MNNADIRLYRNLQATDFKCFYDAMDTNSNFYLLESKLALYIQ